MKTVSALLGSVMGVSIGLCAAAYASTATAPSPVAKSHAVVLASSQAMSPLAVADDRDAGNTLDYPAMINVSNYPARVQAIHFDNSTIDATNSTSWGAWTVSFGTQPPVATYMNNGIAQVQISGLVCTNAIAGNKPCGMNISPNGCAQSLGLPNTPPMLIACPQSIALMLNSGAPSQ